MIRACMRCGRIHKYGECTVEPLPRQNAKKNYTQFDKIRNTKLWQRTREAVKKRDNFVCAICWCCHRLTRRGLQVHHIVKLNDDVSKAYDLGNLITVCTACHERVEGMSKEELLAAYPPLCEVLQK